MSPLLNATESKHSQISTKNKDQHKLGGPAHVPLNIQRMRWAQSDRQRSTLSVAVSARLAHAKAGDHTSTPGNRILKNENSMNTSRFGLEWTNFSEVFPQLPDGQSSTAATRFKTTPIHINHTTGLLPGCFHFKGLIPQHLTFILSYHSVQLSRWHMPS